jgi:hypothetical protein
MRCWQAAEKCPSAALRSLFVVATPPLHLAILSSRRKRFFPQPAKLKPASPRPSRRLSPMQLQGLFECIFDRNLLQFKDKLS